MTAPPPGRDRYQPLFQLADGHRRLGYQAAAASDQVTVHREYQAALGLLRQLAEVVPVEQDLLRDLAAGHHREGNHAAVMGYGLAARYEYQADLVTVLRQLALADPVTGELLRPWTARARRRRLVPGRRPRRRAVAGPGRRSRRSRSSSARTWATSRSGRWPRATGIRPLRVILPW
ncbi:MAG TPA: hypothetical protein VN767_18255 [Streptosporangiaceae bacterium]|nr:hypothetical protein [Streptosporangiaceae bacterium]